MQRAAKYSLTNTKQKIEKQSRNRKNMIAAWSRSLPRKRKISLLTDAASFREDATQEVNTGAGFLNCGLKKLWIICTAVLKFIRTQTLK